MRGAASPASCSAFSALSLAVVLLVVVVVGEWLGLFEAVTARVPWPIGAGCSSLVAGWPGLPQRGPGHPAAAGHLPHADDPGRAGRAGGGPVGDGGWSSCSSCGWATTPRRFTTERARRAVKDLTALAPPPTPRRSATGSESSIPVGEVQPGEIVVVRPGEKIPVDGEVVAGQATVDQAAITGESMPVEAGPGRRSLPPRSCSLGSLRIRATRVGADTTFGRVIKHGGRGRSPPRRTCSASPTSSPATTCRWSPASPRSPSLIRRDPLATAAVLVVACSCSFALATPIAMLASIGAGAKRGLLIKGGKYLETLAAADVLLIDKTGTLTLGRPADHRRRAARTAWRRTSCCAWPPRPSATPSTRWPRPCAAAAPSGAWRWPSRSASRRCPAWACGRSVDGRPWRWATRAPDRGCRAQAAADLLRPQGKTLLYRDGRTARLLGLLAAADTLRPEVPAGAGGAARPGRAAGSSC